MEMKYKIINNLKGKILKTYIILALFSFICFIVYFIYSKTIDSIFVLGLTIGYIIIYFISKYMHLTSLGKLYHVFIFLPLLVACIFSLIIFMI